MQSNLLTPQEFASVSAVLIAHAKRRGNEILGSQLGSLINRAIYPRTVRTIGGLKALVDNDLASLVVYNPSVGQQSDARLMLTDPASKQLPHPGPQVVLANDLWRIFSNPNFPVSLHCTPAGVITADSKASDGAEGPGKLVGPSTEDYRVLAKHFAEKNPDPEIQTALISVLAKQDFYNDWVSLLRQFRSKQNSIFNDWGMLRAEFVATKLQEGLINCGVEPALAAEILVRSRPPMLSKRSSTVKSDVAIVTSHDSPTASTTAEGRSDLKSIIHEAVDLMSTAELRELRIPAGILHDLLMRRVQV